MPDEKTCPHCGKPVPPTALGGICPECMLKAGLATQTEGPHGTKITHPPPSPAEIASLFPQLEILECLGRGGMGVVYKARQPRLNRLIALKILAREKQQDAQFTERFTREAQALARLSHPNIVTVHDFGEAGGHCYLVMEFVDGLSLRQLLQTGKMQPEQALTIVPKICEALQYAHEQGIVHRDIKPENILLDKQGRVKIADFGIAKMVGVEAGRQALTGAKDVMGTPHYMAPEQIEKPQTVDHRADIYSLGVVFYEMLTGELPLGKFQPPSKKVQMDVRLDEVVFHALEKEPERRYQQVSVLKTEVETIAGTVLPAKPKADQSAINEAEWRNPNNWSLGFYFSKRDSRKLWVPRRIRGLGWTINLGRWQGAVCLLGIIISLILLTVWGVVSKHADQSFYIGQTWFPEGDSIEIMTVGRTQDRMVVKGHYNLVSHNNAELALYITTTSNAPVPTDPKQRVQISKGRGDFELTRSHLVPGLPYVSMDADGKSFAALFFGTKAEAVEETKLFEPVAKQIEDTFAVMSGLKEMESGRQYELEVGGKKVLGTGDDFLRRRNGAEILGSSLSSGCGDYAIAFVYLMEKRGLRTLFVDSAEVSLSSLESHFSGHVVVAVRDPVDERWSLADPTNKRIITNNWSTSHKTFYGDRYWIGYCGPLDQYPAHTPDELK